MDMRDQIKRLVDPIITRVRNVASRGVIKLVNDKTKIQQMQASLLAGELKDGIENYQNYGFSSVPLKGMEVLVVFCGGDRSNGVVVASGDRTYRLKELHPGEVAIYTDEGDYIKLARNRKIQVNTLHLEVAAAEDVSYTTKTMNINASNSVNITTPVINASQNISAGGDINDKKSTLQAMRNTFNGHNHPGDSGGSTGTPNSKM